jgi:hypothetical protein
VPTADRGDIPEHWERFAELISHRVPLLRSRTPSTWCCHAEPPRSPS